MNEIAFLFALGSLWLLLLGFYGSCSWVSITPAFGSLWLLLLGLFGSLWLLLLDLFGSLCSWVSLGLYGFCSWFSLGLYRSGPLDSNALKSLWVSMRSCVSMAPALGSLWVSMLLGLFGSL